MGSTVSLYMVILPRNKEHNIHSLSIICPVDNKVFLLTAIQDLKLSGSMITC
jgi:hypothetical protein